MAFERLGSPTLFAPIVGVLIYYGLISILSFRRNKRIATEIGLPIISVGINPMNPFRLMFANTIIALLRRLPVNLERSLRFHAHGWESVERFTVHCDYGDAFVVVSPGGNYLYVCDAKAINQVLQRRNDFARDVARMSILNVYGKNISTTEGAEWQVHRKVTAAAFNESTNEVVWKEALKQAEEMLCYWTTISTNGPVRTIAKDTRTFTLNVLAASLFSKRYSFEGSPENDGTRGQDPSTVYRDSLSTVLGNIIPLFMFGKEKLSRAWWLPNSWRVAGKAAEDFETYVSTLIREERANPSYGPRNSDLISSLVRACDTESSRQESNSTGKQNNRTRSLTEQEIISNIFVYAFAGNDTTAITLAHVVVNMAAHPDIQDWVREEIQHYTDCTKVSQWDYNKFHKLKRCLAVMMETLRLCHPLSQLIKTTGNQAQCLDVRGSTYVIPPYTNVNVNLAALHTLPRYWGNDSLLWNPRRHIVKPTGQSACIETEQVNPDTTEEYLPWAYGQKACPGKRFSQVELVAALAKLFRNHRVIVYPEAGETQDEANARAKKAALATEKRLLNEMKNASSVGLRWVTQNN